MKINISRQSIYLLTLSLVLLVFVLLFAFLVLIPEGKNYREKRVIVKKERSELRKYQLYNSETEESLQELQSKNRHIITAFDTDFNPSRFKKQYSKYFSDLSLTEGINLSDEKSFAVYEVNTTSKIDSPKSFYDFLDALNKSDWIISVNFPINFTRENSLIKASFNMKVYSNPSELNSSTPVAEEAL